MTKLTGFIALGLMIGACSGGNQMASDSSNAVDTLETETKAAEIATASIFGTTIHLDERMAIQELAEAGILSYDTIKERDGRFAGSVVEFAGIKFGMNKGFLFLTSKHDKKTLDALISKISEYYGEPDVDDHGEPESNYYHWNLHDTIPGRPYIRIRPTHSEDGGLSMTWSFISRHVAQFSEAGIGFEHSSISQ